MALLERWMTGLRRLHWQRGLRAGIAVLAAMLVCHLLGRPMGWAALGGFESILVDNGGPYRSRLTTILTLLAGGAAGLLLIPITATPLWLAVMASAVFCFAMTYGRALSSQLASTSVIILVIYFVGFGEGFHTIAASSEAAISFVLGGLWAAAVSLILWPLDPFRPARQAVADCYDLLAAYTSAIQVAEPSSPQREQQRQAMHRLSRSLRAKIENARNIIGTTGARGTVRTIRARSLTVLLETADILFAVAIRRTEISEEVDDEPTRDELLAAVHWLARAERVIAEALRQRPADGGSSFAREGSHSVEHLHKREIALTSLSAEQGSLLAHLIADERGALLNIEVAFEAVRAIWSGVEYRSGKMQGRTAEHHSMLARTSVEPLQRSGWAAMIDAARANWTLRSLMMRHALRVLVVAVFDVLVMRSTHFAHGAWLGMTSIIVLQPYGSGTLRRGMQRVGGTIAGGVLAAMLAILVKDPSALMAAIVATSVLTLATYAVDYAWFCFFLTPTFVLMSQPHPGDWALAGVRIAMTTLGSLIAVLAMWLLWPERGHLHLERMLARCASADASYVRAMLEYWKSGGDVAVRAEADRSTLAPARRACGLAINDAEEMLDRLMLEPRRGRTSTHWEEALTFVTYLRRITRAVTTLAVVGAASADVVKRMEQVACRLDAVASSVSERRAGSSSAFLEEASSVPDVDDDLAEHQVRRLERQTRVLERTAAGLLG